MANWRGWIRPGLAVSVVLTLIAVVFGSGSIEENVARRVAEGMQAAGLDWVRVSVDGRAVALSGMAPTEQEQLAAVEVAGSVLGVADVTDGTELLPIAAPYVWSGEVSGNGLLMRGHLPSEAARYSILAAARRALPEAEIVDETTLARGAPPAFGAATAFAFERLADLSEGLATITDGTLSVAGLAATFESYDDGQVAFAEEVPAGVTLGPVDIQPARADPFVWSVSVDDSSVTLAGFVPNRVARAELEEKAAALIPGIAVVNNMNIASGEPEGFLQAAGFALDAVARLEEGGAMLDGLVLDVAGRARTVDDYEAVVDGIGGALPVGVDIVANEITPPMVDDYTWTGERDGDRVVLTGYVPTLAARTEVNQLADELFGDLTLENNISVASGGARMDWIGAIKFAMGQLEKLQSGTVEIAAQTYSIVGEARDSDTFLALNEENGGTLPASLQLRGTEVTPPRVSPFTVSVRRTADGLAMSGYLPNPSDRTAIVQALRVGFPSEAISLDVSYAAGGPPGLVDAIAGAVPAMARLAGGQVTVTDSVVEIDGTTFHESTADRVSRLASQGLPEGFTSRINVVTRQVGQPLTTDDCGSRLGGVTKSGNIEFDKGASDIAADSYTHLDRIAGILMRCPQSAIEIAGHSDSDGSEDNNLKLTQARADAVLDYLVDAGVTFERLEAVGYGEAEPIADNDTEEGKAANRRIEFTLSDAGG